MLGARANTTCVLAGETLEATERATQILNFLSTGPPKRLRTLKLLGGKERPTERCCGGCHIRPRPRKTPGAPTNPQPVAPVPPAPPVFGCVCAPAAWQVAVSSAAKKEKKEREGAAGDPSCEAQPSPKPFFPFSDVVHSSISQSPSSFSRFPSSSLFSSYFSGSPNAPTNDRLQNPSFRVLPTSLVPCCCP